MHMISVRELRRAFSNTLNRVAYQSERIGIVRHGKLVAVLLPVEDVALLTAIEDRVDREAAERSLAEDTDATR